MRLLFLEYSRQCACCSGALTWRRGVGAEVEMCPFAEGADIMRSGTELAHCRCVQGVEQVDVEECE